MTVGALRRLAAAIGVLAIVGVAAPAAADPGAALAVSGVRVQPGEVEFLLSARDLPAGVSLNKAEVTVRAHGEVLSSTTTRAGDGSNEQASRGVVVVFDTSGSMAGAPLATARAAVAEYVTGLPDDVEVGLVSIGDTARTVVPPTADHAAVSDAATKLRAKGKTALYDGVARAGELLSGSGSAGYSERRILVLSDGEDTASGISLEQLSSDLGEAGLTVDAVAFGAEAGGPGLRGLTEGSGGRLITAADGESLAAAFRSLAGGFTAPVRVTVTVPPELAGRDARLDVEVSAGNSVVRGSAPVTFDADPEAAAPLARDRVPPSATTWLLPGLGLVTAAAMFLVVVLLLRPAFARYDNSRRLAQIEQFRAGRSVPARAGSEPTVNPVAAAMLGWAERAVESRGATERITAQLQRAGVSLRPNEWLVLRICLSAGAAGLLVLVLPWWAGVLLGGIGGWLGTRLYLSLRAGQRARRFGDHLPDALQLVIGALRSGFSLPQSVDVLVREGGEPVSTEFGRALARTRLGVDLEEALDEVAHRTGSQDMAWLVMAIRIQRDVGGNLAEVLETAVDTMRERGRLRRHVRALSAEGRLSAWVLTGMPIALTGWMAMARMEYLRPLFTEPLGIAMLAVAAGMVGFGAFWMSRLVKVEV